MYAYPRRLLALLGSQQSGEYIINSLKQIMAGFLGWILTDAALQSYRQLVQDKKNQVPGIEGGCLISLLWFQVINGWFPLQNRLLANWGLNSGGKSLGRVFIQG